MTYKLQELIERVDEPLYTHILAQHVRLKRFSVQSFCVEIMLMTMLLTGIFCLSVVPLLSQATFLQFAFRWMNCLLTREVHIHLSIRLWDTFFAECDIVGGPFCQPREQLCHRSTHASVLL